MYVVKVIRSEGLTYLRDGFHGTGTRSFSSSNQFKMMLSIGEISGLSAMMIRQIPSDSETQAIRQQSAR